MSSQGMAGDKHSADGFPIPMRGNETECGYDHDSRTLEFPIPIRGNEHEYRWERPEHALCSRSP